MKRPSWIRGKVSWDENSDRVRELMDGLGLHSVCVEAACPNKGECWEKRHVTFLILGDTCTRGCLFCNVAAGIPAECDPSEPERIAAAVRELDAKYVVITSVTRDDLQDRGTGQFVRTVNAIKEEDPGIKVELLIPDLDAEEALLREIAFSAAEVIGHNIEMPRSLYREVRPRSDYTRSLDTLGILNDLRNEGADIFLKSSLILGLGETKNAIMETLRGLKEVGVDIVYMGQYLSPSREHWPVKKFYTPEEFRSLEEKAGELGFKTVCSGPMVRSSYHANEAYLKCESYIY